MATLGGRHRQRGTGRLVTYWAAHSCESRTVFFAAVISEDGRHLAAPDDNISFDPALMSDDEAVRQAIGRYIDEHTFGQGEPASPNWTDYGPWK